MKKTLTVLDVRLGEAEKDERVVGHLLVGIRVVFECVLREGFVRGI